MIASRSFTDRVRGGPEGGGALASSCEPASWHALWTRSNFERRVCEQLGTRGFHPFLPMIEAWSRGGRRRRPVPMFPSYLFVHDRLDKRRYTQCLQLPGVVAVLGRRWDCPAVIAQREMETVQRIVDHRLEARHHPYLRSGMRVRVVRGPLTGLGGILLCDGDRPRLVVSVELFRRSVAVTLEPHCVVVA